MHSQANAATDRIMKSMTGFGRGRQMVGEVEIVTEIRSVNHRFLDVSVRSPKLYSAFEPEIRKIVAGYIQRGKLDVVVTRTGGTAGLTEVTIDLSLAEAYRNSLRQLKERVGISGEITLSDMLTLRELVVVREKEEAIDLEGASLEASLREALTALDSMRTSEGAALWQDIEPRLNSVRITADQIAPLVGEVTKAVKLRLDKRVQELTGGMKLDEERMLQEVALMAERSDVTEELIRIRSHVDQFLAFGKSGSPAGRKLDFLLQELHREVNTLGSKSASTEIATHVVNMKADLEKIREQIQNIE
jgi:uncharacterized protein (TIGR00255 family)